ncbi:MFS general substrate transporter [Sanghuangporus baumii]|uniref:MFS general substrate transporter n=1 Tax=Sanghuangporus baumii TaxID=108892 RepID=A0A9Q5NBS8_SANBA|nr:MFS general substrate transporter [Sanghuangporus baumii]
MLEEAKPDSLLVVTVERERRPFVGEDTELDQSRVSEVPTVAVPSLAARTSNEMPEDVNVPPKSPAMKRTERVQLFALFLSIFVAGWDGGTYGPLLPRFQTYYDVNYTVVSMIFVSNCVTIVLGAIGQVIGYSLLSARLPFPAFCVAFFINGWGMSLQDAQANGYVVALSRDSATKMGIMHAIYGLGAMIAPFSATQFAEMTHRWSLHFVVSVVIAVVNTMTLVLVFRGKTQDECYLEIGEPTMKRGTSQHNKYRQIFTHKVMHVLAFYSFVYVGVEITISGWTVSYLQEYRDAGASSGYVSTGFFGGITLGRVALLWVNKKIGEYRVMYIYMLLSLGLELVVWLVPSVVIAGVAVSFVGFFLGPIYPIIINEAGRQIPQWLLTGSVGWIASFGFSGSALFPFITGALSEEFGIVALQPVLIVLMAVMIGLWLLVPSGRRRARQMIKESDMTEKPPRDASGVAQNATPGV